MGNCLYAQQDPAPKKIPPRDLKLKTSKCQLFIVTILYPPGNRAANLQS